MTGPGVREPLLLLASQSEGRRLTLERAGFTFTQAPADVDEDQVLASFLQEHPGAAFEEQVLCLARAKAETATRISGGGYVVLGADSMLEVGGDLVGKPLSAGRAVERWRKLRNHSGVLHTGHWIVDDRDPQFGGRGASFGVTSSTRVNFANLDDEEIEAYVATGEPLWVAGAFTIDGLGGPFVESVEGDPHAVVGLSLPTLRLMLREIGLRVSDLWADPTVQ